MSISKELLDAVNNNDIVMVKIILQNSMLLDPSFASYDEELAFALKHFPNLYDSHDGTAFKSDSAMWTKNYLDELMTDLTLNFSRERVSHIRKVCRHIYGSTINNQRRQSRPESSDEGNRSGGHYGRPSGTNNRHEKDSNSRQIGTGLVVGGAAAAVVGIAISEAVVIGAGVAAAVVGGIMIATDK